MTNSLGGLLVVGLKVYGTVTRPGIEHPGAVALDSMKPCVHTRAHYIYIYVCRTFWVYLGIVSSYDYIKYYIHIIFRILKFQNFQSFA